MDYLPKSTTVHKHLHYHYHYDVKDQYLTEKTDRYSSPSIQNSHKNHTSPYKTSWKNHINPQVTKLYEQISVHESFSDEFTPKASRHSQKLPRQYPHTANQIESKKSPRSKVQILQDISTYEEYLKKHSQPNLYVPHTPTLRKIHPQNTPQSFRKRFTSLNELFEHKQNRQKNLQDIIVTRTDSKLLSKQQISTMHETQNPSQSLLNLTEKKMKDSQKYIRQSEIKSPTSFSNVFEKAKIRMSNIEDPTYKQKNEELENSNFSLFQRQAKKQESRKSSDLIEHSLNKEYENEVSNSENKQSKKTADVSDYALELLRDECNFLRNKFITHAEKDHGVKF